MFRSCPRWLTPLLLASLLGCDDTDAIPDGGPAADLGATDAAVDAADPDPDAAPDATPLPPPPDWPMWTGDADNTRANTADRTLDAESVGRLARVWSIEGPGATSTPVVLDGVVYTGMWDGRVLALDATTGVERWAVELGEAHVVDASLAVQGETVYAATGAADLVAINRATGDIRWRIQADAHPTAHIFGSPTVIPGPTGDRVVIGIASIELTQVLDDYSFRGSVVAFDAATGDEVWRWWATADDETSGAGVSVWSSVVVDGVTGVGYVGTGNTYEAPASPYSDALVALDMTSGELIWHRQFTEGDIYVVFRPPPQGPDADIGAAPNLFHIGDRPVVGVGDKAGVYGVLDRATGETIWARELGDGSPLGGIMVSAAVADDTIYVASNAWVEVPNFDSEANTAVAYALDVATGESRWETPLPAPSFGAVSVTGDLMWLTTVRGQVHALDRQDGRIVWQGTLGDSAAAGVTVTGQWLFAGYGFSMFKAPRQVEGGFSGWRAVP